MNKDWKYILYLSIVIGVFVVVKLMSPKQYSWNVTLAHESKDPYGTYALNNLLPSLFQKVDALIESAQTTNRTTR